MSKKWLLFLLEERKVLYAFVSNFIIAVFVVCVCWFGFHDGEVYVERDTAQTQVQQLIEQNNKVLTELKEMKTEYQSVVSANSELTQKLSTARQELRKSELDLAIAQAKLEWLETQAPTKGKQRHESIFD